MNSAETARWLEERDNFLILTHRRPDGDTLGSAAGLCQALREAGKNAFMLENPETTGQYRPYVEEYPAVLEFVPENVVAVDVAAEDMLQINGERFFGRIDLCIDHHPSNTLYARENCIDHKRAACGEIIFEILRELGRKISPRTATLLYIAVSTDTGCFRYGNTDANTLRVASMLVLAGAPNGKINKELFRTKSKGRIALEGRILSGIELIMDGKVAVAAVSVAAMDEASATEDDTDDIANLPGQLEGVIIGVTIREMKDGTCKISVRGTPETDANAICGRLGGGGHKMAAGCTVEGDLSEARERIIEAIRLGTPL